MEEHLDEDIIDVFVNTGDQLSAKDLILKRIKLYQSCGIKAKQAFYMNEYKSKVAVAQLLEIL